MPEGKMTRRMLPTLLAISLALLAYATPQSAQERHIGNGNNSRVAGRSDVSSVEELRSELIGVYAETEALINFLAGFDFIRQGDAMKNYEAIRQKLELKRERLAQMSAEQVMAQASDWPDKQFIDRITTLSEGIRSDAKLQEVIHKAELYAQAGNRLTQNPAPDRRSVNSRSVIASPAYIAPTCDYDDPSNYPSGVDLGIAGGVSIALHFAADLAPGELEEACTMIPNPIHIAFAIAAGVADEVKNALTAIATDSAACERTRLNIEDKLKDDRGITTVLVNNDYYLAFMYKSVKASLSVANGKSVPTNCGDARFTEASAFFDGSGNYTGGVGTNRLDAYKLLRAAYQNIGASACVQ